MSSIILFLDFLSPVGLLLLPVPALTGAGSDIELSWRSRFGTFWLLVSLLLLGGRGSGRGRRGRLEVVDVIIVHGYLEPGVLRVGEGLGVFPLQFELGRSGLELQGGGSDAVGGCRHLVRRGLSHGDVLLSFCIIEQRKLEFLSRGLCRLVFPEVK